MLPFGAFCQFQYTRALVFPPLFSIVTILSDVSLSSSTVKISLSYFSDIGMKKILRIAPRVEKACKSGQLSSVE